MLAFSLSRFLLSQPHLLPFRLLLLLPTPQTAEALLLPRARPPALQRRRRGDPSGAGEFVLEVLAFSFFCRGRDGDAASVAFRATNLPRRDTRLLVKKKTPQNPFFSVLSTSLFLPPPPCLLGPDQDRQTDRARHRPRRTAATEDSGNSDGAPRPLSSRCPFLTAPPSAPDGALPLRDLDARRHRLFV